MRWGFTALIILISTSLFGVNFEPQGFLDTYYSVRMHDPYDYLSSRTRLRLEAWITKEKTSLFASINAINNNVITSNSGIELREAYMEYVSESWDFRIGRQIIVWGKADGMQITDIISPMDYTEFLARDYDDIRMPVDSLKVRLLGDSVNFEMIWLPVFVPSILPEGDNPWAVKPEMSS